MKGKPPRLARKVTLRRFYPAHVLYWLFGEERAFQGDYCGSTQRQSQLEADFPTQKSKTALKDLLQAGEEQQGGILRLLLVDHIRSAARVRLHVRRGLCSGRKNILPS